MENYTLLFCSNFWCASSSSSSPVVAGVFPCKYTPGRPCEAEMEEEEEEEVDEEEAEGSGNLKRNVRISGCGVPVIRDRRWRKKRTPQTLKRTRKKKRIQLVESCEDVSVYCMKSN